LTESTLRDLVLARPFLRCLTAQGFRGIGQNPTLDLTPGPGLTRVVGRNGSGKSSFTEGLELLLTGDTCPWSQRSKVPFFLSYNETRLLPRRGPLQALRRESGGPRVLPAGLGLVPRRVQAANGGQRSVSKRHRRGEKGSRPGRRPSRGIA
jgi:hypothetical protein